LPSATIFVNCFVDRDFVGLQTISADAGVDVAFVYFDIAPLVPLVVFLAASTLSTSPGWSGGGFRSRSAAPADPVAEELTYGVSVIGFSTLRIDGISLLARQVDAAADTGERDACHQRQKRASFAT